jgi:hypothetical protein
LSHFAAAAMRGAIAARTELTVAAAAATLFKEHRDEVFSHQWTDAETA